MTEDHDRYLYRITWSEEDGEFVGLCAEFPGLSWLAKKPEAALQGVRKVVKDVIDDMHKNGEILPPPLSGRTYSGKFMVRIPPEIHRNLALKAAEEGISLNRLISARLSRI